MLPSLSSLTQPALVACNIYVSAGRPKFANLLTNLLDSAQDHCTQLNESCAKLAVNTDKVVMVHAFCDGPYDRSSFHIAGSPQLVADAASFLIRNAIEALMTEHSIPADSQFIASNSHNNPSHTPHPTVGLVDHVSVLPLDGSSDSGEQHATRKHTGLVAQHIGNAMENMSVDVLYYGHAHPDCVPLARVRREKTKFFQANDKSSDEDGVNPLGQATVGAPDFFTENFNIRLKAGTPKKVAQSLTRHVREKEGTGLPYVEALTLPYSDDRFEVACNLLHPTVTSAEDIVNQIKTWDYCHKRLVETSYRVGTTADMCLEALQAVADREEEFNEQVKQRFQGFIKQQQCAPNEFV